MKRVILMLLLQSVTFNFPVTKEVEAERSKACASFKGKERAACESGFNAGRASGVRQAFEFYNR